MHFLRVWKNHQIIVRWNILKSLSIWNSWTAHVHLTDFKSSFEYKNAQCSHTVGLFHSMWTGTFSLKKREESLAGKSGSSNRTPFMRHSCLSCSKDFPSDCVFSAWLVDIFSFGKNLGEWRRSRWGDAWWSAAECLMQRQVWQVGRAGRSTPSRQKLVCPPAAVNLTPRGSHCAVCSLYLFLFFKNWPAKHWEKLFLTILLELIAMIFA